MHYCIQYASFVHRFSASQVYNSMVSIFFLHLYGFIGHLSLAHQTNKSKFISFKFVCLGQILGVSRFTGLRKFIEHDIFSGKVRLLTGVSEHSYKSLIIAYFAIIILDRLLFALNELICFILWANVNWTEEFRFWGFKVCPQYFMNLIIGKCLENFNCSFWHTMFLHGSNMLLKIQWYPKAWTFSPLRKWKMFLGMWKWSNEIEG
jgi:hypothetical protein